MCLGKPECHRCETCGVRKYQLWVGPGMHDRGCPWGYQQMDTCPDAVNHAKLVRWGMDNGVNTKEAGVAFVAQMEAMGVDLKAPPADFDPTGEAA